MIFLAESTFIFGSWICTADDCSKLQGRLMEISADQATPANPQGALEDLIEKIDDFSIFGPTRTQKLLKQFESHADTVTLSESDSKLSGVCANHPVRFQLGLRNSVFVYQELI